MIKDIYIWIVEDAEFRRAVLMGLAAGAIWFAIGLTLMLMAAGGGSDEIAPTPTLTPAPKPTRIPPPEYAPGLGVMLPEVQWEFGDPKNGGFVWTVGPDSEPGLDWWSVSAIAADQTAVIRVEGPLTDVHRVQLWADNIHALARNNSLHMARVFRLTLPDWETQGLDWIASETDRMAKVSEANLQLIPSGEATIVIGDTLVTYRVEDPAGTLYLSVEIDGVGDYAIAN